MRHAIHAVFLAALCRAASDDFFNKPEKGTSLNISAPITIAWDQPERPRDDFHYLDIEAHFVMPNPNETDGTTGWTIELASNLTLSRGGEFEWDPSEVEEFVAEHYNDTKARGKPVVTFHAAMKGPADGGSVVMQSEEFEIAG